MTKCHLILLAVLVLLPAACKSSRQESSLSDYGARSQVSQMAQFEQFVFSLREASPQEALFLQDSLLRVAERDSAEWARVTGLEEKFLLDPNSPYRDEDLYIPVARHLLTAPWSTQAQRRRAEWLLPRLHLNRPGQAANDFEFVTPKGRRSSLYAEIARHKPQQTLLFFSNPGCPNCKEITETLDADEDIRAMIDAGTLLVVNIYPDEDVTAWLDYLPNYPTTWVCGQDADQVLNKDTIYWLRAIPSLYLLDAQGCVVCKDATLEDILINCKQR